MNLEFAKGLEKCKMKKSIDDYDNTIRTIEKPKEMIINEEATRRLLVNKRVGSGIP